MALMPIFPGLEVIFQVGKLFERNCRGSWRGFDILIWVELVEFLKGDERDFFVHDKLTLSPKSILEAMAIFEAMDAIASSP